jgi:PIN domain nuclease of toxin-antitoxin system
MEYLADTVAIIRYFSQSGTIGKKARNILDKTENNLNRIFISIISLAEIMYLAERGRIPLNLFSLIEQIENCDNYQIIDLDVRIIKISNSIKNFELHDRLIVSTAKLLNIPLLTSDSEIKNSKTIEVIWD